MTTILLIQVDRLQKMARVAVNNKTILEGNFYDFHPGCVTGLEKYGEFRGYIQLSTKVYQDLLKQGIDFREIKTIQREYTYHKF